MRQETIIKTYLTFEELNQEQKNKAIELNFENDNFHSEFILEERINTLRELTKYLNGHLDYSISVVPDRGEFIKITNYSSKAFRELYNITESCPFTGMCYDDDILCYLKKGLSFTEVLENYLNDIHKEYEATLTVEYISDHCEANEYEFDADTLKLA